MISNFLTDDNRQRAADAGLLVLRCAAGAVFIAHGFGDLSQEGGVGVNVENYRGAGIPVPELAAPFGAFMQFLGGIALIAGLITRLAGLGLVVVMAGALIFVHPGQPLVLAEDGSGSGFALIMAAAALTLVLTGPGRLAVDHVLGRLIGPRRTAEPELQGLGSRAS
ncbi:DoxX family protein [Microlunatus parietis]|uniref:Putative oxidoreductase n=1 Tax=Microlunatus parietis TaxID=682979 RepID=A0A7Y9ICL8_9ACTN|nr:DoxX family protein [Microlunatus parietis]NYE74456.1 putative oxidoreductase [Microlunatus parietis]